MGLCISNSSLVLSVPNGKNLIKKVLVKKYLQSNIYLTTTFVGLRQTLVLDRTQR